MKILGIETSCDETAVALIETRLAGGCWEIRVIDSLVHSQAELHDAYGGVYPSLAKREHTKNLPILIRRLLDSNAENTPDFIAVTEGPGLEPALWVGITFARELGAERGIPVIPVDHMEGHVVASLLDESVPFGTWQKLARPPLPALALLISGGHTELVLVEDATSPTAEEYSPRPKCPLPGSTGTYGAVASNPTSYQYTILGSTRDDAVGEAFDKVARLLGEPYPGGPHIARLAREAAERGIAAPAKLPRPMISSGDLNFSFSGIKTAVLYTVRRETAERGVLSPEFKMALAREFQEAVTEVLVSKTRAAIESSGANALILGGGVTANAEIRKSFKDLSEHYNMPLFLPAPYLSGDNALMIAIAGAMHTDEIAAHKDGYPEIRARGTKRIED